MGRFRGSPAAQELWEQHIAEHAHLGHYPSWLRGYGWYEQMGLTIILENQRILSELIEDKKFSIFSRNISFEIFDPRRFGAWDWISFQPHPFLSNVIYWTRGNQIACEPNVPRYVLLKTDYSGKSDNALATDIRNEILINSIRDEILAEIINDIRTNVGKTILCSYSADFDYVLPTISKKFKNLNALSIDATFWIITNLEIAEELCEFRGIITPNTGISQGRFGTYDGWDVYVAPESVALKNEVILGCKDGPLGSGYCFAPYIPFVPTLRLPESKNIKQKESLVMRYSKAWRRDARKYFTKVVFI